MSRVKFAILGLMLAAFIGCGRKNDTTQQQAAPAVQQPAPEQTAQQPSQEPEAQQSAPEKAPSVAAPESSRPAMQKRAARNTPKQGTASAEKASVPAAHNSTPVESARVQPTEPPVPAKPPEPKYASIPSGTEINVRLQTPLDSGVNKSGDPFQAILDQNIEVGGTVIARKGSIVEGKLSNVEQSGRVQGRASMSLQLVNLMIDSQAYPLQTEILTVEAESTKKKDATKVGIGAGLGAVIGAIAGGGKGAAIGAAAGAGAGGAAVVATRGKEVKFDAEHKLTFALRRDVNVRIQ
jgi:hypothetical protein